MNQRWMFVDNNLIGFTTHHFWLASLIARYTQSILMWMKLFLTFLWFREYRMR